MTRKKTLFSLLAGLLLSFLAEFAFLLTVGIREGGMPHPDWKHILAGFVIYTALILACGAGNGWAREKEAWRHPAGKPGKLNAYLKAVLIRVLFAADLLLFLYLCLEGHWNTYRTVFLIPAVLLAEIPLLRFRPGPKPDRLIHLLFYVWLVYAILYYVMIYRINWAETAPFDARALQKPGRDLLRIMGAFIFLFEIPRKPWKALVSAAVYVFLFAAKNVHGSPWLTDYMMLVLLADLAESPRKTAKVYFWSLLACVGLILAVYFRGWSVPMLRDRSGLTVNSFGLRHTNNVALMLMTLLMLGWYIRLQKKPFVSLAVLAAGTAGIWVLSTSRSSLIVLILFGILLLPWYFTVKKNRTGWLKLIVLAPPLAVAASVILTQLVPSMWGKIDNTFIARFFYPTIYLTDHPLTWMGSRDAANIVLDNLPWYLILRHGILSCALFFGMYTLVSVRFCRNRQWAELLLLLLIMVYSVMENPIIYISFGFVPLLVSENGSSGTKGVEKAPEPPNAEEDRISEGAAGK